MKEIGLEIVGYEGLYYVTSWGNTWSKCKQIQRNNGTAWLGAKRIKQSSSKQGYRCVCLRKDGSSKVRYVHRLVAETFLPNPDNLPCVNHKDENGLNNHVDNLEWCTYKYNTNYGTCIQRRLQTRLEKTKM